LRRYWTYPRERRHNLLKITTDTVVMLLIAFIIMYVADRFRWWDTATSAVVIDGDSLKRGSQRIRLFGIDAPELGQECLDATGHRYRCGEEARRALRQLVQGHEIACAVIETDRYQRDVARCRAGDRELNWEMVRQGWAIAYRRQSLDFLIAEAAARKERRGLWRGDFELPEHYRARKGDMNGSDLGGAEGIEID
jgi:endonuclease YncB( thermonuclease family)